MKAKKWTLSRSAESQLKSIYVGKETFQKWFGGKRVITLSDLVQYNKIVIFWIGYGVCILNDPWNIIFTKREKANMGRTIERITDAFNETAKRRNAETYTTKDIELRVFYEFVKKEPDEPPNKT